MRVASDLMSKKTIIVQTNFTISQCMDTFLQHKISTAPVVDANRKLQGILSEFALIRAFASYTLNGKDDSLGKHMDLVIEAVSVLDTEPVHVVIASMKRATSHRLVVTNRVHHVVGVISPCDVMNFLNDEHKKTLTVNSTMKAQEKIFQSMAFKKIGKEIKNEMGAYENLLGDMPYPLYSVDAEGKIIFANRKLHKLLDCPLWSLVGRSVESLYTQSYLKLVKSDIKNIAASEAEVTKRYVEMVVSEKKTAWVQLHTCPYFDSHGKSLGAISVLRPVDAGDVLRALSAEEKSAA